MLIELCLVFRKHSTVSIIVCMLFSETRALKLTAPIRNVSEYECRINLVFVLTRGCRGGNKLSTVLKRYLIIVSNFSVFG